MNSAHVRRCYMVVAEVAERMDDLQEAEARFRRAFDDAAIGMSLTGVDGRFLRVNPALAELIGYEPDRLVQMGFPDITHEEDVEADIAAMHDLLSGERESYETEKRYVH